MDGWRLSCLIRSVLATIGSSIGAPSTRLLTPQPNLAYSLDMDSSEYLILREMIGSQDKASKLLDVTTATIYRRETGKARITREAEFAIRWATQEELVFPTPNLIHRVKKSPRRKR